jgi:hypothetical protein
VAVTAATCAGERAQWKGVTQLHVFRLPTPKIVRLTPHQREILAWVEFNGGRFSVWPKRFRRITLRTLMVRKLVKCTALSPARYVLTGLGRAVRRR